MPQRHSYILYICTCRDMMFIQEFIARRSRLTADGSHSLLIASIVKHSRALLALEASR